MNDFFLHLLNKIEIFTGIRQLERLQAKPEQLVELVDECSKAALQFPLKEEIVKSVLMDAVSSDQDFIGLNVKWVRKVLNLYCQVHGVNKQNQKEEVVNLADAYNKLIEFWQINSDKDPLGQRIAFAKQNLNRVMNGLAPDDDAEGIKVMGTMYAKQIENTFIAEADKPQRGGSRLREQLETIAPIPKTEPSALEEFCQQQAEEKSKTGDYAEETKPE